MYSLLVILVVLASILMCLIVLIQESKGGGLASSFSDSNAMLGVRKTTDVVEKITWGLVIAMVVFSVLSVAFLGNGESAAEEIGIEEVAQPGIETGAAATQDAQQAAPATEAAPAQQTAPTE